MSYLLKFTTPFGIPVGVLKAGRSFSPSLMAFTRNTCKGRSMGHHEWGWVGAIPAPRRSCRRPDPGAASAEWEGALRRALESGLDVNLAPRTPGDVTLVEAPPLSLSFPPHS